MRTAVEYGVPTDKCALQLRLGIEKGFFADEGIDLAIRVVFGGPEIAAATRDRHSEDRRDGHAARTGRARQRRALPHHRQRGAARGGPILRRAPALFRLARSPRRHGSAP